MESTLWICLNNTLHNFRGAKSIGLLALQKTFKPMHRIFHSATTPTRNQKQKEGLKTEIQKIPGLELQSMPWSVDKEHKRK
jgi:hypothetical protein